MFGRASTINANATGVGSHLIEFKAGRMNMAGKMVHPDSRKGVVYLTQSEDGLMHFCWKDRTTGKVEDDLIVFPDDFEFKRVEQCKTGRVFVLKFKTSTRRLFFWMQEPKVDKDEEYCRRVNELMNNPPSATQRGGNGGTEGGDLQYMLNNMSQQQLMQLFGGVGQMGGLSSLLGSMNRAENSRNSSSTSSANRTSSSVHTPENTTTSTRAPGAPRANRTKPVESAPTTDATASEGATSAKPTPMDTGSTTTSGGAAVDDSGKTPSPQLLTTNPNLQTYLSKLSPEAGAGRSLNIDLSTALTTSDAVNEVLDNTANARTLSVHLPESVDSDENKKQVVKDTIASPQFQQALTLFSNALQSAQLGPIISQFELTPEAVTAAFSGNLEDFVEALEKALPAGTTMGALPKEKEGSPKKDNPDAANKGA